MTNYKERMKLRAKRVLKLLKKQENKSVLKEMHNKKNRKPKNLNRKPNNLDILT